ncbi:centromere-associated protein E-like isoform X2 [Anthonomus grandis grandis]|uniref:centromere-associated protein E-like isoform X2 n=1 Tax=Anthonomus grandis grandis TaxID=2921223 RepID=UPI0021666BF0|nr:centromere-associated protein E-like isoform X2 [Anthonomus grandis grandis]
MNKEKVPKTSRSTRPPPANVNRSSRPQTGEPTSIFGSLRRLKSGVSTSTPKKPPDLEVKKKLASSSGVSVRVDNNANVTSVGGFEEDSGHRRRRGKENIEEGGGGVVGRRPVPGRTTVLGSKNRTKGSAVSLQQLIRPRSHQSINKPKRPISVSVPGHVTVRRGHKEGQGNTDNLSRTSSITNLDSLESSLGKGAKPRKAASKERIDKQSHDGKKVTKNNNKLEPPTQQPLTYSSDSLQHSEAELQQLRKQLRDMADEKSSLALQLGEQRGQLNVLQNEILKLKCFQEESNLEMEKLAEENTVLRNRLRDVAHSPLSDNEKQQLLFDNRHHNSAPASIATNAIDDTGGDATTCTTPDWDKQSSGNVSEVSVACLQDKINQMQETHYSTNEELQATLQELTDLQRQLTELQQENERLNEEKTLMFDSLCRQTERLKESRQEVEKLNQLIYSNRSDETGINQFENAVEREQQLVEVLRTAQDEREQLLLKLDQIQGELQDSRKAHAEKCEALAQLTERLKTLECTLDAKNAEHKQLDQELTQTKDQYSGKQIEVDRLSDLLETARTKIIELEQDRALSDKSELDEMLDNARKEKDQLESEVTYLKEQLARSKNEIEKLKEQVFMLQEECKVTRNNAKTTQADLEYKCEKVVAEKNNLNEQLQQYQEVVNELQLQSQCHLEDKRQLSAVLSETQRNMSETERKNINLENELLELKKLREEENDEWEKFQNDLLTSVRVANDFKTEAQQELQKIILENKTYREKVRLLEGQLEKLKGEKTSTPTQTDIILTPQLIALAKNLDPSIPNRVSLLEKPDTTGNMERLFPILNRKCKSKENLADVSTLSGHRRQRSDNSLGLKKSKSKDDLREYGKERGSRGFLKWNRSKENLNVEDEPKEKKGFFKRNKSQEDLDKPRKSKDSSGSSEGNNSLTKMIKRREKKSANRSKITHPKFMSVEEEMLLQSLDSWYENIDQNTPDELLTQEEKAVRKLKVLYEDDTLKEKPVAHKPKEHLAISKPLLNSVVLNPKLEQICRDPKLITVHPEVRESALEDCSTRVEEEVYTNIPPIFKSKSLEDINVFEEYRTESSLAPVLYGPTKVDTTHFKRVLSDIDPNDSVSNPRRSIMYHELPKPNVYINYENLDEIVGQIPRNVPENRLTEEQKFAKKLKSALDDAEKKTTLKKSKKSLRGQEISAPTRESVEKNWKLKEILLNPRIKAAEEPRKRHSTDISSDLGSPQYARNLNNSNSKSYEDISFSFVPENTLLHMHYGEQIKASKYTIESSSSSSQSFTSAEFNLDTGTIVEKADSLLYNDTVTRTKEAKVKELKRELSVQEEEEIHHPKILKAKQQYEIQLQESLKRIHHDELRASLRKQRGMDQNGNFLPVKYEDVKFEEPIVKIVHFEDQQSTLSEEGSWYFEPEVPIAFRDKTDEENLDDESPEANNCSFNEEDQLKEYYSLTHDIGHMTTLEDYPAIQSPTLSFHRHSYTSPINSPIPSTHRLSLPSPNVYLYEQTLKENRYGVVSPLNLRYTYRHVVEEYKEKFPSEEEISPKTEVDYVENTDDFIDEFFRPVFAPEESEGVVLRTSEVNSKIDQEMEEIMEKYLHTRASLLVKKLDEPAPKTNLKKYETMEELGKAGEERITESEDEPLSLQDLQFIEEMKSKYASNETLTEDEPIKETKSLSFQLKEKKPRPLSELNEQDLALIDEISRRSANYEDTNPRPFESSQKDCVDELTRRPTKDLKDESIEMIESRPLSETVNEALRFSDDIRRSIENASHGEELIREIKPRPLSETSEQNLRFIDKITPSADVVIGPQSQKEIKPRLSSETFNQSSRISDDITKSVEDHKSSNFAYHEKDIKPTPLPEIIDQDLASIDEINEESSKDNVPPQLVFHDDELLKKMKPRPISEAFNQSLLLSDEIAKTVEDDKVSQFTSSKSESTRETIPRLLSEINEHDLRFIDENTRKSANPLAFHEEKTKSRPLSHINQQDLALIDLIDASIRRSTDNASTLASPEEYPRPPSEANAEDLHHYSVSVKDDKSPNFASHEDKSRPLSDITRRSFNAHTLQQEMTPRPSSEILKASDDIPPPLPTSPVPTKIEEIKSPESLIPVRKEKLLPPSLRPKKPEDLPKQFTYGNVTFRNSSKTSSPVSEARQSKRLSELMFKETIFVPTEQESEPFTPTRSYKQQNSYRESVFVASPTSKIPTPKFFLSKSKSPFTPEPIEKPKYQSYKETVFVSEESHQRNSWTDSLKEGLLDNDNSYEPVYYSNVLFPSRIPKSVSSFSSISKKPLPLPRVSSFRSQEHLVAGISDTFDTMSSSNENFSEVNKSSEPQPNNEIAGDRVAEDTKPLPPDVNDLSADAILVDQSKARTDIFRNTSHHEELELGKIMTEQEEQKSAKPPSLEDESIEEVPRNGEESDVNLFHMDSQASCDSYLELFKTKESKEFDILRGKKPHKTFAGFTYVEEILAEDASSISTGNLDDLSEDAGPKIVGFVPLDNQTTPVFTKPAENVGALAQDEPVDSESIAKPEKVEDDDLNSSVELLAKKPSTVSSRSQSSSRTSFSQAKKIFEALEEAHKDEPTRPKSAVNPKSQPRVSLRDSRSLEQIKPKSSDKESIGERGLLQ